MYSAKSGIGSRELPLHLFLGSSIARVLATTELCRDSAEFGLPILGLGRRIRNISANDPVAMIYS